MKYILFLVLAFNLFTASAQAKYQVTTTKDIIGTTSVLIPIEDIFEGKCISRNGCMILDEIVLKIKDKSILIEVFCSNSLHYDYSWETGNMYAYKISKCLIDKGINPHKIRHIGYGELGLDEQKEKNIIKISIQEPETMWLIN